MMHCVLVIYKKGKKFYSTFCAGSFVGKEKEIKRKDIDSYVKELKRQYPNLEIRK